MLDAGLSRRYSRLSLGIHHQQWQWSGAEWSIDISNADLMFCMEVGDKLASSTDDGEGFGFRGRFLFLFWFQFQFQFQVKCQCELDFQLPGFKKRKRSIPIPILLPLPRPLALPNLSILGSPELDRACVWIQRRPLGQTHPPE